MILIDAQLSPFLAAWIAERFNVECRPLRELDLRDAEDWTIFQYGRTTNAIIMTKDEDFVSLLERHGPPPQILWITCGNTSNAHLRQILNQHLPGALRLLAAGEPLVEISGD
jgi:predicted nuclease of predicted toxin-antitoxin system